MPVVEVGKKLKNDSDGTLGATYSALAAPPSEVGLGLASQEASSFAG